MFSLAAFDIISQEMAAAYTSKVCAAVVSWLHVQHSQRHRTDAPMHASHHSNHREGTHIGFVTGGRYALLNITYSMILIAFMFAFPLKSPTQSVDLRHDTHWF